MKKKSHIEKFHLLFQIMMEHLFQSNHLSNKEKCHLLFQIMLEHKFQTNHLSNKLLQLLTRHSFVIHPLRLGSLNKTLPSPIQTSSYSLVPSPNTVPSIVIAFF